MKSIIRGIGMTSQRTRDRLVERLRQQGFRNETVLNVIRDTPRHLFVDEALASRAYEDTALPIGYGQTISQPYVVAVMTDLVIANHPGKVLEVGTGSGYQAAVLAQLVDKVYTVERISPLLTRARRRFRQLGLQNVRASHDDGNMGWAAFAPYDSILVTAAAAEIPDSLLEQLSRNGRLIMPVGERDRQRLVLITRKEDVYEQEEFEPVSFVPLLGGHQ